MELRSASQAHAPGLASKNIQRDVMFASHSPRWGVRKAENSPGSEIARRFVSQLAAGGAVEKGRRKSGASGTTPAETDWGAESGTSMPSATPNPAGPGTVVAQAASQLGPQQSEALESPWVRPCW